MNKKPIDVEKDTEIERVQKILAQFYPAEPKGSDTRPLHQQLIQALLDTRVTARREARVQALEEAARAVCGWCMGEGQPILFDEISKLYYHLYFQTGERSVCSSSNIRQLIAAEQGQGERKVGE